MMQNLQTVFVHENSQVLARVMYSGLKSDEKLCILLI